MLWLILGALAVAALVIYAIRDHQSIPAFAGMGLFIGAAIFITGNSIGGLCVGEYEKHTATTHEMLALTTFVGQDASINGSYFILSGTIIAGNETYAGYRYYTRDNAGRISLNESRAYSVYLIEDGKNIAVFDSCDVVSNKANEWFTMFGNQSGRVGVGYCTPHPTELHISAGSVTTEVNVPLPR